jgi:ketosteroid isomerase-like protein
MSIRLILTSLLGLAAAPLCAQSPVDTAMVREVRERETAFAATMAARDLTTFATFIADEAVFFGGAGPIRGRDAIVGAWSRHFEGPTAPFSWAPDLVEVLGTGDLALTSGPVRDASGTEIGRFNSIWRRDRAGTWKVVFDRGS